jgi:hypothetical protein
MDEVKARLIAIKQPLGWLIKAVNGNMAVSPANDPEEFKRHLVETLSGIVAVLDELAERTSGLRRLG